MKEYGLVVITANDDVQLIGLDDYHLTLADLYKYSDCDTIQILQVRTIPSMPYLLMCIDDNGKIVHKPINRIGTVLYGAYPRDFIVGDLVLGTSFSENPNDEPDIFAMSYQKAVEMYEMVVDLLHHAL